MEAWRERGGTSVVSGGASGSQKAQASETSMLGISPQVCLNVTGGVSSVTGPWTEGLSLEE